MKKLFKVVSVLMMAVMLAGSVSGAAMAEEAAAEDTIKIGVIAYLSAAARAAFTGYIEAGWDSAVDKINEEGGIDGKKVELVLFDPEGDAALIPQRCTDAKEQGCAAIVFCCGDDLAPTANIWAEENKFPILYVGNTSTEMTIKNFSKYSFFVGKSAWSFARILAKVAVGEEGKQNFVFCGTDGAGTIDAENLLIREGQMINPDFEMLASYRVAEANSEFSNIIQSIATEAPDMILQQGSGSIYNSFVQQGEMFGLFNTTDVYNDFVVDSGSNDALVDAGGFPYGKIRGVFLLPYWDEEALDDEMKEFCDRYMSNPIAVEQNHSAPNDWGLQGYRAVRIAAMGIQACVENGLDYSDGTVLAEELGKVSWTDCTGEHYFRELDNQLTYDMYYGITAEDENWRSPIATGVEKFTADEHLPSQEDYAAYAEVLGVESRF